MSLLISCLIPCNLVFSSGFFNPLCLISPPLSFIHFLLSLILLLYSCSCLPSSLSPHLSSPFLSKAALVMLYNRPKKMYCTLCMSPSISFIVWVMMLSFSRRVAIWRTLEQRKSDAPVRHNCSLKRKSHEFLIYFFTFLSYFATCPSFPPQS